MIISDLNYIEVSQDSSIEGGFALAISPILLGGSSVAAQGPNNAVSIGAVNILATVDPATGVNTAAITNVGLAFAN